MKTQVWQAILCESDRFGFEPVEPHWLAARRGAALHDPYVPHFWWSELVPFFVGCFTDGEAHMFALTLERIASVRREAKLDLARSPFNELIELSDLSSTIDLARLGTFEWSPDQKGGMILRRGIGADSRTMLGNLEKLDPPGDPPESCDLSEWAEIRRLGADPQARAVNEANAMEMTWWGLRSLLCVVATQGMHLSDPGWEHWLRYYAYYDPARVHYWWNTGYLHVTTVSGLDVSTLKNALLKYLSEPNASLHRMLSFPEAVQNTDAILALSSITIEEIRGVLDICAHGSLHWTVYSDGIVILTSL